MSFKEVKIQELQFNPFTKISKDWFLITAGDQEKFNSMTASWGNVGHIWNKDVLTMYIRPQRYTKELIEKNDKFTVAFLPNSYRKTYNYLGTVSGRDEDKMTKSALTPVILDGEVAFEEAELVFVCKKLYQDYLKAENFLDKSLIEKNYPEKDFHEMYIAEILKVYVKD